LEHIETFENHNVWLVYGDLLAVENVVHHVAIQRSSNVTLSAFDFAQHAQQFARVVTLGKTLAVHNPTFLKYGVGI
jgi:hypothetical protein